MVKANTRILRSAKRGWQDSPLLKNASITFALRVSGAALLFVFNWVIVQLLGVSGSGVFFLAFTLLNIFSTLCLFGIDQHSLRKIASLQKPEEAKGYFIKGGQFVFLSSLAGSLLLLAFAHPLSVLFESPDLARAIMAIALIIPFLTLTTYLGGAVRAKKQFGRSVFILTNSYYLISILFFGGAWAFGRTNLTEISLVFALAMLVSFGVNLALTYRLYGISRVKDFFVVRVGPTLRSLSKSSYHLFLVSVIYLGFGSLTLLLVGYFRPDADVSIYSIAEKEAKLLTFSLFAINIVLAPAVSKFFSEGNFVKLNREIQKSTILSIAFSLPLLVAFLVFPGFFLGLFGQEYVVGANALRLLTIGQAINAATGAVLITMTMANLEKKLNLISIITLCLQLVLGVILIPAHGIMGAAWSTTIGWSLINILGAYYLNRYHSIRVFPSWKLLKELTVNAKNSLS